MTEPIEPSRSDTPRSARILTGGTTSAATLPTIPDDCSDRKFYLQPGEWRIESETCAMKTLLGSCVGITFWHPRKRVGAMCHAMIPAGPDSVTTRARGRYVDLAIQDIAGHLDRLGISRQSVEVKVFGGADVLDFGGPRETIGCLNISSARQILAEEGFRIAAECLGGNRGVVIEFDTATGEVLLRRLVQPNYGAG